MRWPKVATDERSVERVDMLPTLEMLIHKDHAVFLDFIK